MKKILFIGVICLLCSISVFSQSKKKWEQTQTLNSIVAYQDFIAKYPKGKYIEEAKLKIAQLEFIKVKQLNTVSAYKYFITKTSNEELLAQAKFQIDRIQAEEAYFNKAKEANSLNEITTFINKYPNSIFNKEANQLLEKLDFEHTLVDSSLTSLNDFLNKFPKSQYAEQVNKKIPSAKYYEAITIGTDEAIIKFIKSYNDSRLIKDAIAKLKTYLIVDISKTIPWESLKTVSCGSAESGGKKFLCGINYKAFSSPVNEISRESFMAGPLRFYDPDTAWIVFFNWTEFDGFCVKSTDLNNETSDKKSYYTKALIKKDGLLFESNAIVLKKFLSKPLGWRK